MRARVEEKGEREGRGGGRESEGERERERKRERARKRKREKDRERERESAKSFLSFPFFLVPLDDRGCCTFFPSSSELLDV